jgi:1,4-alpha-glucan branching enzyme
MNLQGRNVYSAHRNLRAMNFVCAAPEAKSVSLVGDFNAWNPASNPLSRGPDGVWTLRIELRHGHHRYAFLVDGNLLLDPKAMGVARDDQNRRVSLIAVS